MSRVLFLHHNFPAQFRFLALHLAGLGHEVIFLSERNNSGTLPGIRQITVKDSNNAYGRSNLMGQIECSERFRRELINLSVENWIPDVIVSHSGWGCGLHANEIFPKSRQIVYVEWWFANGAADYNFDPDNTWWSYSKQIRFKLRQRNLTLALELAEADALVAPTLWQKKQLPSVFQSRCEVIHEGVDTNYFVMNDSWKPQGKTYLTYATRGMEPMRGFPEFVQTLPELLADYPKLEVLIAGDDRVAYGSMMPKEGSFGKWASNILHDWIQDGRVRFLGHLPYNHYARFLKMSSVHCYLTRPFVLSWSLLDAMASGCCLVASDVEPVREAAHETATFWVDHRSKQNLIDGITQALDSPPSNRRSRGKQQRELAVSSWNRTASLTAWMVLLGI